VRERNGIVIAKPAEGHLHVQTYGMRARLATVSPVWSSASA
jgi:hypothetical protein